MSAICPRCRHTAAACICRHYRHAQPHPARDIADGTQISLAFGAVISVGLGVIIALVLLDAGPVLLALGMAGLGAALTGVYRAEQRYVNTDIQPTEEVDR